MSHKIQDGDPNDVCLAKVMIQIWEAWNSAGHGIYEMEALADQGILYANEVLSARDD